MSPTRTIDVKKQRDLSVGQTAHLCVKGITHRLLRSMLTLAVVTLAVAFFMFLLSEGAFISSVGRGVSGEISEQRFSARFLSRVFAKPTSHAMARRLDLALSHEPERLTEYAAVTGWKLERVSRLARLAGQEQVYGRFFEELPVGKRMVLIQKRKGRDIFRHLQDSEQQEAFADAIRPMLDLRLPGEMAGLTQFVEAFPAYERELSDFLAAWGTALAEVKRETDRLKGEDTGSVEAWLSGIDIARLREWRSLLVRAGFVLEQDRLQMLREQLRMAELKQALFDVLSSPDVRDRWRKEFKGKRMSADAKLLKLDDSRVVGILDNAYEREELVAVAKHAAFEKRLASMERRLAGKYEAAAETQTLSGRQLLLLIISFLVCMTGIANAMLMSITERFREIATMKCLGATDRYILIQFMMEAALQGIAGGLVGMLIGFLIALIKNMAAFGAYIFTYWSSGSLALSGLLSVSAGVLLAVLASVYPSWAASRMAPMEAMRVE